MLLSVLSYSVEGGEGGGVNIEDLYHIKLYPDYRYFIFPTWD